MIGDELRRYRIASAYTQKALGEALGLHGRTAENTVYRWEANMKPVPLRFIRRLHELLHIPFDKLIP